jgi:Fic family protein
MKPCTPETLPLKSLDWEKFIRLIGSANFELARYEGILQGIPNPAVLLSPLTTHEAVLSSKIEGTQATLDEVLEYEASRITDEQKHEDIKEILNYRQSMVFAVEWLKTKPITLDLFCEIHSILLDSVRGQNKLRGSFRKLQNYIGSPGSPIEEATFIPPSPERVVELLTNLENYIHYEEKDTLVQLAIVHAQFEIIHPFLDGNGRLGRILIPLFLFEKKMLSTPMFYISGYLEAHRDTYYKKLNQITKNNNWDDWIIFFLTTVIEQSKSNTQKAKSILELYEQMKKEVAKSTRSQFSIQALDTIFEVPIFSTADFTRRSGIPKASAVRILNDLKEQHIITTFREGKGRRPAIMMFPKLMNIIR